MIGTRSEVETRRIMLWVEIEYQYDSFADPERPHVVSYGTAVACGETYEAAVENLRAVIA